ncbi:MAG: response regulator [Candidatus Omnitrophica bacterium]|nr:response regulator [Candidatus Omnitrophota bacterium]
MDKIYKNLLIVDDEEIILEFTKRILAKEKINIFVYQNGLDAWKFIQHRKVDLILLDLVMPVMSGEQLLQKLNQLKMPPPVIVITGWLSKEVDYRLQPYNILKIFTKPLDINELKSAVLGILRQ